MGLQSLAISMNYFHKAIIEHMCHFFARPRKFRSPDLLFVFINYMMSKYGKSKHFTLPFKHSEAKVFRVCKEKW